MRVRCYLREIRGRRKIAEIVAASGVAQPYVSQIERGRLIPRDRDIEALERAYGEPWERWYHPFALKALEADEETA